MERIFLGQGKNGFTLMELLVVIAISGIILLGAFTFFERQQAVFRHQSEQAEKQANLRVAMYHLAKDIALAGYTGTPFGVEYAVERAQAFGVNLPLRPIIHIDVASDPELSSYLLYNQQNEPLDALEIWANCTIPQPPNDHNYTRLAAEANPGTSILYGTTVAGLFGSTVYNEILGSPIFVYPTGVVVASLYNKADYLPISSVDFGSKSITGSGALLYDYVVADTMAPVQRRRYFVQEIVEGNQRERWLIRRDYYANATIDQRLASGIQDFQLFYDMTEPTTGTFGTEIDPNTLGVPFDPCWVTAVTVRIQSRVKTQDMTKPLITTLNRKIKLMNNNIHPRLQNCP